MPRCYQNQYCCSTVCKQDCYQFSECFKPNVFTLIDHALSFNKNKGYEFNESGAGLVVRNPFDFAYWPYPLFKSVPGSLVAPQIFTSNAVYPFAYLEGVHTASGGQLMGGALTPTAVFGIIGPGKSQTADHCSKWGRMFKTDDPRNGKCGPLVYYHDSNSCDARGITTSFSLNTSITTQQPASTYNEFNLFGGDGGYILGTDAGANAGTFSIGTNTIIASNLNGTMPSPGAKYDPSFTGAGSTLPVRDTVPMATPRGLDKTKWKAQGLHVGSPYASQVNSSSAFTSVTTATKNPIDQVFINVTNTENGGIVSSANFNNFGSNLNTSNVDITDPKVPGGTTQPGIYGVNPKYSRVPKDGWTITSHDPEETAMAMGEVVLTRTQNALSSKANTNANPLIVDLVAGSSRYYQDVIDTQNANYLYCQNWDWVRKQQALNQTPSPDNIYDLVGTGSPVWWHAGASQSNGNGYIFGQLDTNTTGTFPWTGLYYNCPNGYWNEMPLSLEAVQGPNGSGALNSPLGDGNQYYGNSGEKLNGSPISARGTQGSGCFDSLMIFLPPDAIRDNKNIDTYLDNLAGGNVILPTLQAAAGRTSPIAKNQYLPDFNVSVKEDYPFVWNSNSTTLNSNQFVTRDKAFDHPDAFPNTHQSYITGNNKTLTSDTINNNTLAQLIYNWLYYRDQISCSQAGNCIAFISQEGFGSFQKKLHSSKVSVNGNNVTFKREAVTVSPGGINKYKRKPECVTRPHQICFQTTLAKNLPPAKLFSVGYITKPNYTGKNAPTIFTNNLYITPFINTKSIPKANITNAGGKIYQKRLGFSYVGEGNYQGDILTFGYLSKDDDSVFNKILNTHLAQGDNKIIIETTIGGMGGYFVQNLPTAGALKITTPFVPGGGTVADVYPVGNGSLASGYYSTYLPYGSPYLVHGQNAPNGITPSPITQGNSQPANNQSSTSYIAGVSSLIAFWLIYFESVVVNPIVLPSKLINIKGCKKIIQMLVDYAIYTTNKKGWAHPDYTTLPTMTIPQLNNNGITGLRSISHSRRKEWMITNNGKYTTALTLIKDIQQLCAGTTWSSVLLDGYSFDISPCQGLGCMNSVCTSPLALCPDYNDTYFQFLNMCLSTDGGIPYTQALNEGKILGATNVSSEINLTTNGGKEIYISNTDKQPPKGKEISTKTVQHNPTPPTTTQGNVSSYFNPNQDYNSLDSGSKEEIDNTNSLFQTDIKNPYLVSGPNPGTTAISGGPGPVAIKIANEIRCRRCN